MLNISDEVKCSNPECRVQDTGRCIEGFDLNQCSHFGKEVTQIQDDQIATTEYAYSPSTGVRLPSAELLIPADAEQILRELPANVIAIVGPADSGKTSLIAGLYELFQTGALDHIEFCSSSTMHAFERASHDARSTSKRRTPHMNRTPLGEVRFYQLALQHVDGHQISLVIGDRAGEDYRFSPDDIHSVAAFAEVIRSDTLTMLIDGERLLDDGARHNMRSEILMILQAFKDGGVIPHGARLALVLTKLDAVQSSPLAERALRDFSSLHDAVRQRFGDMFAELRDFRIAASPKTANIARGVGIPELLDFWMSGKRGYNSAPAAAIKIARPRVFSRFGINDGQG